MFGDYLRVDSRGDFARLVKAVHEHVHVVAHLYDNVGRQRSTALDCTALQPHCH